jgi:hypothetical protein
LVRKEKIKQSTSNYFCRKTEIYPALPQNFVFFPLNVLKTLFALQKEFFMSAGLGLTILPFAEHLFSLFCQILAKRR